MKCIFGMISSLQWQTDLVIYSQRISAYLPGGGPGGRPVGGPGGLKGGAGGGPRGGGPGMGGAWI